MKKSINFLLMVGLMALTACNKHPVKLLRSTELSSFPSGSSLEIYNSELIVMGDDATKIIIVDFDHKIRDSILIDSSGVSRIPKSIKPDYEASCIVKFGDTSALVAFGSGSTSQRENLLKVSLPARSTSSFSVQHAPTFYDACKKIVGTDLNIEGAATINQQVVLANRAHIGQPQNSFLVIDHFSATGIEPMVVRKCNIKLPASGKVVGISGLTYAPLQDMLWFTASTEETANTHDDGAIGDSYLGYIMNASDALKRNEVTPNSFINLSSFEASFKGQKIESLAIEKIDSNEAIIHLVADNDNGTTQLFKISYKFSAEAK
jgi:hypothetical protein